MRSKALRFFTKMFLAGLLILPFTISAEAHGGFRGGGRVFVTGPAFYNPYWGFGWGWGDPFWNYGPYYYPYTTGKIKIKGYDKYDEVYINGAFAGTVDKMKSVNLDPGRYTVQIKQQGKELLNRTVYVVAGKTVDIEVGRD